MRDFGFSLPTKRELAVIAQYRCVRPGCNQATHFYNRDQKRFVHIGVAAHDAPAGTKESGLRSLNDLTPEQKRAYENGAWLCRRCATLVDVAQHDYPLGTLPRWQAEAEELYVSAASAPVPASHIDFLVAVQRASDFLEFTRQPSFEETKNDGVVSFETRAEIRRVVPECSHLFPLNRYSSLYPHTVHVQERMVKALSAIRRETDDRSAWYIEDSCYRPCSTQHVSDEAAGHIRASHKRVHEWMSDYFSARAYLEKFVRGQVNHYLLYQW